MTNCALLILDAQVNMFSGDLHVYQADECLANLIYLAELARVQRVPVIFVMNEGGPGDPDEPGTPGWMLHPELGPRSGDIVLAKHTPDAFMGTQLYEVLEESEINQLVIAGMQTELCVTATCRRAYDIGYVVTLVEDSHTTFDFPGEIPAHEKIKRCNLDFQDIIAVLPHTKISYQMM